MKNNKYGDRFNQFDGRSISADSTLDMYGYVHVDLMVLSATAPSCKRRDTEHDAKCKSKKFRSSDECYAYKNQGCGEFSAHGDVLVPFEGDW
jgi:hypothetical protein